MMTASRRSRWPFVILLVGGLLTATAAAVAPFLPVRGTTWLFLIVMSARRLVYLSNPSGFDPQRLAPVYVLAAALCLLFYSAPATILHVVFRSRSLRLRMAVNGVWAAFYVGCLLCFFPMTDSL